VHREKIGIAPPGPGITAGAGSLIWTSANQNRPFTPKVHKRTDYMHIGINEKDELRALYYTGREWTRWHHRPEEIDDTMACMGPGWFMHKDRFLEQGGCDEAHGSWGQQGVEVSCKAWHSGGALKVNKKTWFAHWFRAGDGGFPYPISGSAVARARAYSNSLWLQDKWPGQKRPFKFLLDKFNPEVISMTNDPDAESYIMEINSQVFAKLFSIIGE
jgi:hypothetical protein